MSLGRTSRGTVLAVAASALALACTSTAEVPWDVRLDPGLASEAITIETSIRRGGCEGVPVYHASIARDRPGPPPSLGRGLHGFAAEARDAECRTIARGCVERDLPLPAGARVELVLEPAIAEPACDASRCSAGECAETDAGLEPIDGGLEPVDGGTTPIADADVPGNDASQCAGATFGTHCYAFHSEAREWSAAEAVCAAEGAHLASLGGPEEAAFVRGLAGTGAYWIGLNDLAVEGIWQWIDGSSSSHRDWAGAENNRDQVDCVKDQPGSGWSVARCRETLAFVCER